MQNGCALAALAKRFRRQSRESKKFVPIVSHDLYFTVEYADIFVGLDDGDVERKVVIECTCLVMVG